MPPYRIGVDVGGTFTDFIIWDEMTGELTSLKLPSTPKDPSLSIHQGLLQLVHGGMHPGAISSFLHGTTVGTNAIIEGRLARTGLVLTSGFKGIYTIDQVPLAGFEMFDFFSERKKALLIPPKLIEEAEERVDFQGNVLEHVNEERVRAIARRARQNGTKSMAVSLLFSFMNPAHERFIRDIFQEEYPECLVSLSTEVLPRIREFPRTSTTVVNASLAPLVGSYLQRVGHLLAKEGVSGLRYVMASNGGMMSFERAGLLPVYTILSGPVAGVMAAQRISEAAGFNKVISMDIGGTSCDIGIIVDGNVTEVLETSVERVVLGLEVKDVTSIGAGGGTLAYIDREGNFRVGPQSAGANPGPVCYDLGGRQPAVTDANVVLGFLNPDNFLGGKIKLNKEKAETAIKEKIASPLGFDLIRAASGIFRIVNAHMEAAIRAVTSERGYDLRGFALFAFGGAGPVHASKIAEDLGIGMVIVPVMPGITSAMGLLMSDIRHDYVLSRMVPLEELDADTMNNVFAELRRKAVTEFSPEGVSEDRIQFYSSLDMRYKGQGYELNIPLLTQHLTDVDLPQMRRRFDDFHERTFGHRAETQPVEVVSYRSAAVVSMKKIELTRFNGHTRQGAEVRGKRQVYFQETGESVSCPIYNRDGLCAEDEIQGPAIIEQMDSTTVIWPGQRAQVDAYGNIIIHTSGGATK